MDIHVNLSGLERCFASIPMDNASNQEETFLQLFGIPTEECEFEEDNAPDQVKACLQPIVDFQPILKRADIRVTVFGTFKSGKSTLLNAMMGQSLLPTRAIHATGVVTNLRYAQQVQAEVIRRTSNGTLCRERIRPCDIEKYILLDLPGNVPKGIEAVDIGFPLPLLKKGCTLVDTPGILDDPVLTERSMSEIKTAELVIMVLSAEKLLAEREKKVIGQIQDLLNGNIVFVVNRLDCVKEEDRKEVLGWARAALKGVGNSFVGQPCIFGIAAIEALDARKAEGKSEAALKGLLRFEQWLEVLLDSSAREKVIPLSRLGILSNYLAQARADFSAQLTEAQTVEGKLRNEEEITLAQQQANWRRRISESQGHLTWLRYQLDQFGENFVSGCRTSTRKLMDSDSKWKGKLQLSITDALSSYTRRIHQEAEAAVRQTGMSVPNFVLSQSDTDTKISAAKDLSPIVGAAIGSVFGLVGSAAGAAVGGWIGKRLLGVDVKEKTLGSVEQVASGLLPTLRVEAEAYLDRVKQLLMDFGQSNTPIWHPSSSLSTVQQMAHYYSDLLHWCYSFQQTVDSIKKEITT